MGRKQKNILISVYTLFLIFAGNRVQCIAALPSIDYIINESIRRFQQVSDYTCILEKKVNKNGVVYYDPEIKVKYRKPSYYYFKWNRGQYKGQEVIYAEGRNRNAIVAHSGGFFRFITLHLDPEGRTAMRRNHHSLRQSGMKKIFEILDESYRSYKLTGCGKIALKGECSLDNRDVWIIEGAFPDNGEFYAAKIILYMDKGNMLPIRVTVYDWSGTLFEEYTFHDLNTNVGLEEKDFDPENTEYNFR